MNTVSVVIAAYNCADTLERAVRSALMQDEVTQVIIVNDASTDNSADVIERLALDDARIVSLSLPRNAGPSAARNLALQHVRSDYVAILDSDDCFAENRFKTMLSGPSWDMVADNIVFMCEPDMLPQNTLASQNVELTCEKFIEGNTSKGVRVRTELGFLKPVISTAFLKRHSINYDESLRLGEDFDLYVRLLSKGAKFGLSLSIGYVSFVRENSLSGMHATEDLRKFYKATLLHHNMLAHDPQALRAAEEHSEVLRQRLVLRQFLDKKSQEGLFGALVHQVFRAPSDVVPIFSGIARAKIRSIRPEIANLHGQILLSEESLA